MKTVQLEKEVTILITIPRENHKVITRDNTWWSWYRQPDLIFLNIKLNESKIYKRPLYIKELKVMEIMMSARIGYFVFP